MEPNWKNPYADKAGTWLKGNLHCHSTQSDGNMAPPAVAEFYAKKGYDFLSITDHRTVTPLAAYAREDLALLTGVEADFGGRFHMGILAPPGSQPIQDPDEKDPARQQEVIDRNVAAGNLVVLHHPDWEVAEHYPMERLLALSGYQGIEVYNGIIEVMEGSPLSTAKWDRLLAKGRRVLGFANQDLHRAENYRDCANLVRAAEATPAAIFAALARGNFYAYFGVAITDVGREGERLFVRTENAELIRFVGHGGNVLAKVEGREAEIAFKPGPVWQHVRIECLGRGEAISFTQPFYRD
ncbi:MAG: hypothetical protein J0L75_18605 [Spirochaetes bacterium]|nr:hypothetical protein [Spirochaetota bacterium]